MLLSPEVLSADILALPGAPDPMTGGTNFAGVIAKHMSLIQAGSGTPGIITFNKSIFATLLAAMPESPSGSAGGSLMANNWGSALLASTILHGTVTDPGTWTFSSSDILTLPSAVATIVTASSAIATLSSQLASAKPSKTPIAIATAYYAAFKEMKFLCMGLKLIGPIPLPFPVTLAAQ